MKNRKIIINASHRTCRSRKLLSDMPRLRHALTLKSLRNAQEKNKTMLSVAFPYMNLMAEIFRESGSLLALTDNEGYILKLVGPSPILESRRKLGLKEGTSLKEEHAGTNAASLCLRTEIPFYVTGNEYYLKILRTGSCYAAPIIGDECAHGVIAIIHPKRSGHPHTFALTQTLARLISREYQEMLHGSFVLSMCDSLNIGVMITNGHGKVVYMNIRARHLLKTKKGDTIIDHFASDVLSLGSYVNEVVFSPRVQRSFLLTKKIFQDKLLFFLEPIEDELKREEKMKAALAPYSFDDIIGLKEMKKKARSLAMRDVNVLITGESGTGKELFASAIHNSSMRAGSKFVIVNCAAIPETLFESELFGYSKGAFTDARDDRCGRIEYASGGTLFLDEIGDLPIGVQSKLLRVIEDKRVTPLGSNKSKDADVRFIFATNCDLEELVRKKKFREDLYYRINTPVIKIPPLRERMYEVPTLVEYFMKEARNTHSCRVTAIDDGVLSILTEYDYPGNVRELQGIIRNAYLVCKGKTLHVDDLEVPRQDSRITLRERISRYTNRLINERLHAHKNNVKTVARELGVSTRTIYRYLKK
jgi:transcriptional regulator of acetoin/glycerol metabolism